MSNHFGRYEVLYKLGQGAMASVFLAKDPVLSRLVAVKVLHPDLAARADVTQRFFNEARTVAVIRNPHVVEVFDFGQEGRESFIVMEFVDGQSLQGVLRQLGWKDSSPRANGSDSLPDSQLRPARVPDPLDAKITAALICQAAEGLSMAARHGVVHRDIKPENLMINQQGYLKISDFGIAHVQDDSLTKTGAILGSPLYMSPEQARGAKPITAQSDMFSLGAVFYCCLTGYPPFKGQNLTDLFRKIASEAHTPLWMLRPDLDPTLISLVETLLQKDPMKRGDGARWLHRQLRSYLMAAGVADAPELIAGYLQALSAQGIQTTWKIEPPRAAVAQTLRDSFVETQKTSLPQTLRASRYAGPVRRKSRMPALAFAVVVIGLGIGAWMGGLEKFARRSFSVKARKDAQVLAGFQTPNSSGATEGKAAIAGGQMSNAAGAGADGNGGSSRVGTTEGSRGADSAGLAAATSTTAMGAGDANAGAGDEPDEDISDRDEETTLLIQSSPPFAEAFLDGRYVGVTPVRIPLLTVGRHRVIMKSKHGVQMDTLFTVQAGGEEIKLKLDENPPRVAVSPE